MEVAYNRPLLGPFAHLRLLPLLGGLLWRQLQVKRQTARLRPRPAGVVASAQEPARKLGALRGFVVRMFTYNRQLLQVCWSHLASVAARGQREVVLYGDGDAAQILHTLSRFVPLHIRAVCPFDGATPRRRRGLETWTEQRLRAYDGMVIVAAFVNSAQHKRRLERLGIDPNRLVVLE